jgi:hypothetical protein
MQTRAQTVMRSAHMCMNLLTLGCGAVAERVRCWAALSAHPEACNWQLARIALVDNLAIRSHCN